MESIHVLVVDRESEFTDILTDHLNSWGFAAASAEGADEAMEMLGQTYYGVVVLGIEGKKKEWLQTLDRMREGYPATKVILLAGKGAALTALTGIQHGAFDVISHPLELGVLCEAIRRAHRHSALK
jgi:DNA-binding NtrC family response regulator